MPGIAMNGQVDQHKNEKPKLIGYRGYWYDISTFIPHHPGGEVIEKFIGQDATCVIDSMHKYNVLEKRKPGKNFNLRYFKKKQIFRKCQRLVSLTINGKNHYFS